MARHLIIISLIDASTNLVAHLAMDEAINVTIVTLAIQAHHPTTEVLDICLTVGEVEEDAEAIPQIKNTTRSNVLKIIHHLDCQTRKNRVIARARCRWHPSRKQNNQMRAIKTSSPKMSQFNPKATSHRGKIKPIQKIVSKQKYKTETLPPIVL
jgi:hypothetical protein